MNSKAEKRGSLKLIVDLLTQARGGVTISVLAAKLGNVSTVNRYLPLLLECKLINRKKSREYFLTRDGRKLGVIYTTTQKGFNLIMAYGALVDLLSEDNRRVAPIMFL